MTGWMFMTVRTLLFREYYHAWPVLSNAMPLARSLHKWQLSSTTWGKQILRRQTITTVAFLVSWRKGGHVFMHFVPEVSTSKRYRPTERMVGQGLGVFAFIRLACCGTCVMFQLTIFNLQAQVDCRSPHWLDTDHQTRQAPTTFTEPHLAQMRPRLPVRSSSGTMENSRSQM